MQLYVQTGAVILINFLYLLILIMNLGFYHGPCVPSLVLIQASRHHCSSINCHCENIQSGFIKALNGIHNSSPICLTIGKFLTDLRSAMIGCQRVNAHARNSRSNMFDL